ncbi:hypothetical protein TWF696_005171 [Orbilia brochopaga]|uniref:Uncharacterized protein n=1 Tax=Orbilia brochopaga TaxID=3140254 RepID=A0AAV9V354_9PEZI
MRPYRRGGKLKLGVDKGKARLDTIESESDEDNDNPTTGNAAASLPDPPPRPSAAVTLPDVTAAVPLAPIYSSTAPPDININISTNIPSANDDGINSDVDVIGSGSRWPIPEYRVLEFVRGKILRLWPYAHIHGRRTRLSANHPPATRYWTIIADDPRVAFAASLETYRSRAALTRWPRRCCSPSSAWSGIKSACGNIGISLTLPSIRPCSSSADVDGNAYNSRYNDSVYNSRYNDSVYMDGNGTDDFTSRGRKSLLNSAERKWLLSLLLSQTSFSIPQSWIDHVVFEESPPADHGAWLSRSDTPWIAVNYPRGRLCLCIGD